MMTTKRVTNMGIEEYPLEGIQDLFKPLDPNNPPIPLPPARPMEYMYLAGPIAGLTYSGATGWREYVAERMPRYVHCLTPLRGKDFLAAHEKIETGEYVNHPLATDKGLTRRDMFDVKRSRIIFINLLGAERVSIGTCIEIGAIKFNTGKLVILLMEEEGNVHDHPMIREMADYVLRSLDEGIAVARAII